MRLRRATIRTLVLLVLFVAVLAGIQWFYFDQRAQVRSDVADELGAIGQLKAQQISRWRSERLADGELLTGSRSVAEYLELWLEDPRLEYEEEILERLEDYRQRSQYESVTLVDTGGNQLMSVGQAHAELHPEALARVERALREGRPSLTDLHIMPGESHPHIDVVAPMFSGAEPGARPLGAVLLEADAEEFLYPMIQAWPTPSVSAESLLVARDGDHVVYLNDLRHTPDAALELRVSLADTRVPAVRGVLGETGIVHGVDYRGVPVIASLAAIPDSPWYLVAKIDEAEALSAWKVESRLLLFLVLGVVATTGGGVALVWQRDHAAQLHTLLSAERARLESEERYGATLMSVGDGVIATDAECRVTLLNPVAEELTGWSYEEARGRPLEEVFVIINEYTRETVVNPARDVLRDGAIVGLANHTLLIARDGTERPIADSGAPVSVDGETVTGVVLVFRDQTEERTVQAALQLQRDRLEAAERHAGLGSWEYYPETGDGWWSPQMCRLFGCDPACDPPGFDGFIERVHPEDRAMVQTALAALSEGNLPALMEFRTNPEYGPELVVSSKTRAVHDDSGRLSALTGTILDVTERSRSEAALRASKEQYGQLFDHLTVGLAVHEIITDDNGVPVDYRFVQVNPAFEEVTGLDAADLLGRTVLEVMPGTEPSWIERYGAVALTGEPTTFEDYSRELDRYYEVLAYSPKPGTFATVVAETTVRRRVENELRESQQMLRLVLDTIPVRVFWKDRELNYLGCNRPFAIDAGCACPAEVLGKSDLDMPWAVEAEMYRKDDTAVIESGKPKLGYEEPQTMPDGTVVWLRTSKVPLVDAHGETIGVMATYEDISALKEARDELERINRSLEQRVDERTEELQATNEELQRTTEELLRINEQLLEAGEAKSKFLRAMSHELRTPLNSIIGFSGVMLQGLAGRVSKEQRRQLEMIDNAGRHLLALINDILDLSRIEAGKVDVTMGPVDVEALTRDIVNSVSAAGMAKELDLTLELTDSVPGLVSDERKIRQILINLLGNAVKFTDEGSVTLSVHRPAEAVVAFSVRDTGPGIALEDQDRIFGEFTQGTHGPDPEREGTGLGLAISRGLAAALGGMVTVESEVGEGATFTLLLPEAPMDL